MKQQTAADFERQVRIEIAAYAAFHRIKPIKKTKLCMISTPLQSNDTFYDLWLSSQEAKQ